MEVRIEANDRKGAAIAVQGDQKAGEMTFSLAGDALIIIDHTDVSDDFRGHGVGLLMLHAIVELARKQGSKILPLCPYANAQFEKDVSIQDVLR